MACDVGITLKITQFYHLSGANTGVYYAISTLLNAILLEYFPVSLSLKESALLNTFEMINKHRLTQVSQSLEIWIR